MSVWKPGRQGTSFASPRVRGASREAEIVPERLKKPAERRLCPGQETREGFPSLLAS